ncbi:hypothetical protein Tco_0601498 [Tanacetum coccineum]
MSNRHQELASPEQTVSGKDFSNPLIVDSLLKTIWFINAPCFCNEALAIPGQTATGKEFSNPLMADSLPKTILSTKKKAKIVISDKEDELVSEDSSKQGRIEETEYADVEEENAGVEYDFDLTEQQVTPLKTPQVEEQSQEMFKAELSVLGAVKILVETSNGMGNKTTIEVAKNVQEEEQTKVLEQQEQERANLEAALNLQNWVEALQTKYSIIDWEIHTERSRKYWKIIRVGNITKAYQGFKDMVKAFDREDLDTLWSLVKEKFRSVEPTEDMERALWVELKRIYEPDKKDTLWKLQRYMHDHLTWRLYGSCAVHHVIFQQSGALILYAYRKVFP